MLGIEVANLFNCKRAAARIRQPTRRCRFEDRRPPPARTRALGDQETNEDYVDRKVDEYYAKGVRVIFPIHNFDNAFGAPATWQDAIDVGNRVSEGDWWDAEDCPGDGYGFELGRLHVR